MKAIVQRKYGAPKDVLRLQDIDRPVVKEGEVLVRVRAASLHPDVWHVVTGRPYMLRLMGTGLLKPKNRVPGTDVAGHVESVDKSVSRFHPGDEVFGECVSGNQWNNGGAFAEYASVPEGLLAPKPANLTFEQAAAVPTSGSIALQAVRDQGNVQPGQRVLVNGAGGGVGAFAVQLAKAFGADVTGVDSAGKLDMVRSIGADRTIDYRREDFTHGGARYDLILDIAGNHSFSQSRRALVPSGSYVLIGHDHFGASGGRLFGSIGRAIRLMMSARFVSQLRGMHFVRPAQDRLVVLKELIEAGKIIPRVDRTYPLSEVPEAIRYMEEGNVQGKIVIRV